MWCMIRGWTCERSEVYSSRPMRSAFLMVPFALLACRSAPPTPPPPSSPSPILDTPPSPVDASVAATPSGPCAAVSAEGARNLAALRRRFARVTDADTWNHVAAFNHCEETPDGAWATVLVAPSDATAGDAGSDSLEGLFRLVHVGRDGQRSDVLPRTDRGDGFRVTERDTNWSYHDIAQTEMGVWTLFDYDGDSSPEVIIPISTRVSEQGTNPTVLVWKFSTTGLTPYDAASGFSPVGVEDVDHDGRPDLFTYGHMEGEYNNSAGVNAWLHGPRLVAWSLPWGAFTTSSGVALERNRAACPSPPTAYVVHDTAGRELGMAAQNVACARLWGVPSAAIEQALTRECPAAPAQPGPSCQEGISGLRAMARATPLADLRAAVSFRRTSLATDPDAGSDPDMPRSRFSLFIEGVSGAAPTLDLGEHAGMCSVQDGDARQRELAVLRCWWAGAGTEFRFVRRGALVAVQRRDVDEQSPPGAWRAVGQVAVAANVALRPGEILDAR